MLEIERKFLIKDLPDLSDIKPLEIEQGYISYKPIIRIRKQDDKYFITKKGKGKFIREETETNINKTTYDILKDLIKNNIIKKMRYLVPIENSLRAEIDIYQDYLEGLLIVEVEFNSKELANSFVPPIWFGKEVTMDLKYKNETLSKGIEEDIYGSL